MFAWGVTHGDLIIAALLTLACPPAQATTVVYKDLQDLVQEADGIVAGTVTDVQARYGQDREISIPSSNCRTCRSLLEATRAADSMSACSEARCRAMFST